jgi:hypothetical protein
MKLKINIKFVNTSEILLFDLLDNPGVCAWADHCRTISSTRKITQQLVPSGYYDHSEVPQELWKQQQLVQQELDKTTLPIPLPVDSVDQITQHHLNVWHRWFTDQTRDSRHHDPELATEVHWLHELNQIVHKLETQIHSDWPGTEFQTKGKELNLHPNLDAYGFGIDYVGVDAYGFKTSYVDLSPYRQYHSWKHADLILDQAVQGKTTMQSFFDNDDPKHWDTTGHHISWGGCKIVYGAYRQEIYQGPTFCKWMDQNAVTHQDLWGDYPLGNIVNRDQTQLDRIFHGWGENLVSAELIILD